MVKYIILSYSESLQLNQRITNSAGFGDGITNNYCIVKKHPVQDLGAVIIEPNYEQYFTADEINASQELSPDWTEEPTI